MMAGVVAVLLVMVVAAAVAVVAVMIMVAAVAVVMVMVVVAAAAVAVAMTATRRSGARLPRCVPPARHPLLLPPPHLLNPLDQALPGHRPTYPI